MQIPGRYQFNDTYRFGYQGQFAEKDGETGLDHFEARDWDSRIGRWLNTDPAGQYWSPYVGMGNNPVSGVDPDGGYDVPIENGAVCIGEAPWWLKTANFMGNLFTGNYGIMFMGNGEVDNSFAREAKEGMKIDVFDMDYIKAYLGALRKGSDFKKSSSDEYTKSTSVNKTLKSTFEADKTDNSVKKRDGNSVTLNPNNSHKRLLNTSTWVDGNSGIHVIDSVFKYDDPNSKDTTFRYESKNGETINIKRANFVDGFRWK